MRATGYCFESPREGFKPISYTLAPEHNQVVVKVAGCGLCHTDVGFYYGDVSPRAKLPLVLGHEISGTVVEAGADCEHLLNRNVIIPSVVPCGECERCLTGAENTCARQFMPGNDGHGGFATHVMVPGRGLAVLPDDLGDYELHELSVIADAVTTPLQTVLRADVQPSDVVIVVGVGGIGTYAVQLAAARGASVIAIDIDDDKLERVSDHGAAATINCRDADIRDVRKQVRKAVAELGLPDYGWKILEMSGAPQAQEMAFALIPPAGTLAVVGFTPAKLNLRLSNLMAFDAKAFGNWGCAPSHYPEAIEQVLSGRITLKPFIRAHDMKDIKELFEAAHEGRLAERAILIPGQEE
jgi:6-hydroxycyclohex-1-ene-1-carbonyl-CoA dehydrogenase